KPATNPTEVQNAVSSSSPKKSKSSSHPPSQHGQHWYSNWTPDTSGRAILAVRILFVCALCGLAALLGFLAYSLLDQAEKTLAETQFQSIAIRAAGEAKAALLSRRWAGVTLSNVVGELYPDSEQWPFVEWLNFEQVTGNMLETSHANDMGFIPFVSLEEQAEWETFAQATYQKLGFPNNTGVSTEENGFGVWARNQTFTPPKPYRDVKAETPYNSPYELLAPIFRTDEGYHPVLLFNPHSQGFTGPAIDQMLSCSAKRQEEYQSLIEEEKANGAALPTMPPHQCGVITDIFNNVKLGGEWSIANFLPIYPISDPLTVTGYISAIFIVDELLSNVFSSDVRGIDAIFETETRSVSYTIIDGQVHLVGEGMIYNPMCEEQMLTTELLDPELFSSNHGTTPRSVKFHLVPNAAFYQTYQTNNAIRATIVVVLSVVVTMLIFFLYDFSVRREFHAKRELLEARRQFMRFVSHEVRTPLNAVTMGLDLMQFEIARALGFDSHTAYRASPEFEEDSGRNDLGSSSRRSSFNDLVALLDDSAREGEIVSREQARSWFKVTQEIQDNSQGAVDILNDLLNYDKIEQGTLQLGLEVLSIWELLEQATLEFKLPASSKELKLGVSFQIPKDANGNSKIKRARDLPKDMCSLKVVGDSIRLTQVLRNLMSNAIKFTPSYGTVHVRGSYIPAQKSSKQPVAESKELDNGDVFTGIRSGEVRIQVIDDGAGMSQDQLNALFQDGVQFNVNQLQAGGGSGLGLYIAKGIVEQHGGHLFATSKGVGHGTTFELTLPFWKNSVSGEATVGVDESTLSRSSQRPSVASGRPLRVLVVDDVKSNRKLLRRLLENNGVHCKEAENGEEAIEIMEQSLEEGDPFDAVLLDYEMPVLNGPETAQRIRRDPRLSSVNIVGITGNVLPNDVQAFLKSGADDVLGKPIKIDALFASWMEAGLHVKQSDP
ncbi:MAG: hypothetical protein SGILL_007521, partial [Bacillariaceae sp.]